MALVPCTECGEQISTTATACPKCGAKKPRRPIWRWVIGVPVAIFGAMMIFGLTIPEYEHRALKARDICYQLADATMSPRSQCDEAYVREIAQGRARANKVDKDAP